MVVVGVLSEYCENFSETLAPLLAVVRGASWAGICGKYNNLIRISNSTLQQHWPGTFYTFSVTFSCDSLLERWGQLMAFITLEYCYYLWHRYVLFCLCTVRCEMWWYQTDLLHLDIPNPNTARFLPHVFPPPCLHLVLVAHIVKVLQNFLPAYIPTANCIVQWHRLLKMLNGSLQSVVCCSYWRFY